MRVTKKLISLGLVTSMVLSLAACGGGNDSNNETQEGDSSSSSVPTIDQIKVGEDYKDLEAPIKILTNRTDIVDTVYKGYAEELMEL